MEVFNKILGMITTIMICGIVYIDLKSTKSAPSIVYIGLLILVGVLYMGPDKFASLATTLYDKRKGNDKK